MHINTHATLYQNEMNVPPPWGSTGLMVRDCTARMVVVGVLELTSTVAFLFLSLSNIPTPNSIGIFKFLAGLAKVMRRSTTTKVALCDLQMRYDRI